MHCVISGFEDKAGLIFALLNGVFTEITHNSEAAIPGFGYKDLAGGIGGSWRIFAKMIIDSPHCVVCSLHHPVNERPGSRLGAYKRSMLKADSKF